jgi:hypothetical protein
MINQLLLTPFIALSAAIPMQCQPADPPVTPAPATRTPQVIYIPQDYNQRFIAESGDTIILIMNNDSDEVTELNYCEDRGGELQYNEFTDILTCYDVDF